MNVLDQITASPPAPNEYAPPGPGQRQSTLNLRSSILGIVLPSLATALLLWMCYFPLACGWLAWGALVPLLCLVRSRARLRWGLLGSWVAGGAFFLPVLQWMRFADHRMYFTWIGLALYCSFYFPLAVGLLRALDRRTRLPLVVSVPVVWTALEYLRGHLATGFAWYFLAHSQHDFLPLLQLADLAGAFGITFLVAAANAVLFELLSSREWLRRWLALESRPTRNFALVGQATLVLLALGGALGYGHWQLARGQFTPGPRIALVQSNLPQHIRNDSGEDAAAYMVRHNARLSDGAVRQQPAPVLLVWPETSYPHYWTEVAPGLSAEQVPADLRSGADDSLALARDVGRRWRTNVLFGMNSEILGGDASKRRYNSAILVLASGTPASRYDKIHRVPFGEYVPLRDALPWMNAFAPYDFEYGIAVGASHTRFTLGAHRFGVLICYEDSDPDLAREYLHADADGPAVDFLVNMSNDGWFDGSSEHEEHLAVCRFRAVECRRAVARSVNMGISAVIDGNGRILQPQRESALDGVPMWEIADTEAAPLPVSQWHRFKKVAGVLTAVIPIDQRESLYVRWGDWLPWGCWLVLALGLVQATFLRPLVNPIASPQR